MLHQMEININSLGTTHRDYTRNFSYKTYDPSYDLFDIHIKKKKIKKTYNARFAYCHCKETHTYLLPL